MTDNLLLTAVDKLTLNHTSKVVQSKRITRENDAGEVVLAHDIACVSVVDHAPLLLQLRDAVGTLGSDGGRSTDVSRFPYNAVADQLFAPIVRQINAWYITLPNAREERYVHDRLRDWYVDFENRRRAGKVTLDVETVTLNMVEGWVRSIEALFDPPVVMEIVEADEVTPAACPVCGGRFAIDTAGDRVTALVVEYRNLGVETFDKATGLCRSCETVWRGGHQLRELRWAVENEPVVTVIVDGFTVPQLVAGIKLGLRDRNMKAVTKLLDLLVQGDGELAEFWRNKVEALVEADKREAAAREALRVEQRRKEREQENAKVRTK